MTAMLVASSSLAFSGPAHAAPNMNGFYHLSETPRSDTAKFPKQYSDYPGGAEYFDVFSPPIVHRYSEVFWTQLPPVPLPPEIVRRFANKTMAVIGFECDQVRWDAAKGEWVPVPINVAYNHHFESQMTGAKSRMVKVGADDPRAAAPTHGGHRRPPASDGGGVWVVEELEKGTNGMPTSQAFGGANGGEYRKSFHGYAPGFAQLIESPDTWHHTPMQIDTFNREKMSIDGGPFVPGPLPRNSLSPGSPNVAVKSPSDVLYSGLLECPVSTRIRKVVDGAYSASVGGAATCAVAPVPSFDDCHYAVRQLAFDPKHTNFVEATGANASLPAGCSVRRDGVDGDVLVYFNTAAAGAPCGGAAGGAAAVQGRTRSLVDIQIHLDASTRNATLTLGGPSGAWFGVGFNATTMGHGEEGEKGGTYAIIVDGDGNVTERQLANHAPGDVLPPSVEVLSTVVKDGIRTVTLRRALAGRSPAHTTFDVGRDTTLDLINAYGDTVELSRHIAHTATRIELLPTGGAPACVCENAEVPFGNATGSLMYVDPITNETTSVGFNNHCAEYPRMTTLYEHNPTCDLRTYAGGQVACHHLWSLLDADQQIPWADQPLNYSHKFRFWFQEYDPTGPSHTNVLHTSCWGLGSPVEYDVPQCAPGTPTAECVHTITGLGVFEPKGHSLLTKRLVAAHFHCHAPTCLSISLYSCAPNSTTTCLDKRLMCRESPLYGGTGSLDLKRFDEPGYIAQPPCLWGAAEHGLEAPPAVGGRMMYAEAKTNSTYGHHGEMAWMQVYYAEEWGSVTD